MTEAPHTVRRGELEILQIDNAACSAEISLFGGHVIHWQPSGHKPVLWMSESTPWDGKSALRGGIPICWPWFGVVEGKGRHGLVRSRQWQLDAVLENTDVTELQLSTELSPEENPWPHPNRIEMHLRLGRQLEQTLSFFNQGETPLCFSYALHNYFFVSHPENVRIPVLEKSLYDDKISGASQQLDPGTQAYTGPIDRIYANDQGAALIDSKFERTIRVEKTGSQHWVLWNPGSDAVNMADVHAGGESQFLCFEAANITDIILPPGHHLSVGQRISVEAGINS